MLLIDRTYPWGVWGNDVFQIMLLLRKLSPTCAKKLLGMYHCTYAPPATPSTVTSGSLSLHLCTKKRGFITAPMYQHGAYHCTHVQTGSLSLHPCTNRELITAPMYQQGAYDCTHVPTGSLSLHPCTNRELITAPMYQQGAYHCTQVPTGSLSLHPFTNMELITAPMY
jgi:hypothetical protein